ncbi:MAG: SDR family NAD(P)-dependent oxidoreductase [Niastella sp.]|nr:SDR family NAD(P)-dependent oxidoreductase [Niastella sp.]
MKKNMLIISAGPGLSRSVAEKFGKEGFNIALISFNQTILDELQDYLAQRNIETITAVADVLNPEELQKAISELAARVGGFDVVHYNAAVVKAKDIMEETAHTLIREFSINAAHALLSLQTAWPGLKAKKGALLLTGGGLGVVPNAAWGSLSIGKAALRSLAFQLHERLKQEGIYVGLLTIDGLIDPKSATHSPEVLANVFWKLYSERAVPEIHYSGK